MKLKFRIDIDDSPRHIHFTVFQDGGNCGKLCMDSVALYKLIAILEKSDLDFEVIKS